MTGLVFHYQWSYGVLCWEVFSSGLRPYPNVSPNEVIRALNEGKRLEKPSNAACSDEMQVSCTTPLIMP